MFFLHQHLNDFDEFCHNVRAWDLDYRQLERGRFNSELLIYGDNKIQFSHARLGRKMLQRGASPEGLISFGILADPGIQINWRNIDISGDMMFVFPDSGELNSISHTDFNVYVISLSEEQINKECELLKAPDIRTLLGNHEVFTCQPGPIHDLRSWLKQIKAILASPTTSLSDGKLLSYIEHGMITRIIRLLSGQHESVAKKRSRKRDLAICTAESIIAESIYEVINISELCEAANVSERTLEYAFQERYGLTPKTYALMFKLNSVRKKLRQSAADELRVCDVARQHGFWHMGKFSSDYKKLFSELPSQTLRR
jgi:AraC family ethanolamine operon transcriptional activator